MSKKKKVVQARIPLSEMPEGLKALMFPDISAGFTPDHDPQAEARRHQAMQYALLAVPDPAGMVMAVQPDEDRLSAVLKAAKRIEQYLETGDIKEPIPEHFLAD